MEFEKEFSAKDFLDDWVKENYNKEYWQDEEFDNADMLMFSHEYHKAKLRDSKTITTHENQPIQDFARQVFKTVKEDWGSHNVEEFIEVFKKEVGR